MRRLWMFCICFLISCVLPRFVIGVEWHVAACFALLAHAVLEAYREATKSCYGVAIFSYVYFIS